MTPTTNLIGTVAVAICLAAANAGAAVINVTTDSDAVANDGLCSLREAVTTANTGLPSGAATGECGQGGAAPYTRIDLPGGTYRISRVAAGEDNNLGGDLDVRATVELRGAGASLTTLRGDRDERVLDLGDGTSAFTVVVNEISLRDGGDAQGGGIRVRAGTALQLSRCMVSNNAAATGGGIYAEGAISIDTCTFHANSATDPSGPGGGAIRYVGLSVAQIRNATFNANDSLTDAGFARFDGPAQLNNITVAETLTDADFNGSGDGALVAVGTVHLANSLIAGNADLSVVVGGPSNPDCAASADALLSDGYNLVGSVSPGCVFVASVGDQTGSPGAVIMPALMPLGPYLGTIDTQPPTIGSPAFDRGNPALPAGFPTCEPYDAHTQPRRSGGRCDTGAVEAYERIFTSGFEP